MLKFMHINGIRWNCRILGESAILLEPQTAEGALNHIHLLSRSLESDQISGVVDVVPAYTSLAVIFDKNVTSMEALLAEVEHLRAFSVGLKKNVQTIEIPVSYRNAPDWEDLIRHTGLSREEIVDIHTSTEYRVAMIGFLPGFMFLEGLDPRLECPRRDVPRSHVPAGSVGIGGKQTGIYALDSPGGWNIIGTTTKRLFDPERDPPVMVSPGDKVIFRALDSDSEAGSSSGRSSS